METTGTFRGDEQGKELPGNEKILFSQQGIEEGKKLDKKYTEEAFQLVVVAGEIQLQSGAEISRVEQTMKHMAQALGLDSLETYIIANGIFATANGQDQIQKAGMKHIPTGNTDLRKIEEINSLSRNLEQGKYTMKEAWQKIEEIKKMGDYSPAMVIAAYAIGAGSFCYALGGSGHDALVATVVGLALGVFFHFLKLGETSKAIHTVLGSMLATFLASILFRAGFGDTEHRIIVGVMITMIPGVSFANAIRDFVENDYVSGLIRLMDVLLTLVSIVAGVVLVWSIPGFWHGRGL